MTHQLQFIEARYSHLLFPDRFPFLLLVPVPLPGVPPEYFHRDGRMEVTKNIGVAHYRISSFIMPLSGYIGYLKNMAGKERKKGIICLFSFLLL